MGLAPRLFVIGGALFGICTSASASPASEEAFNRGRDALQVGKYVEACAAFEDSQRLEPSATTQFNMALCDEQLGKIASALAIYKELAVRDDNPARKARAPEKAAELEQRVARLHLETDPKAPVGLEVTVNGQRVAQPANVPVDLGSSRVVVRAPGYKEWSGQVSARDEKQVVSLTVPLQRDPSKPLPPDGNTVLPPPPPPHQARPTLATRKMVGLAGMIGGGAILAGGLTFGVLARSKYQDAKDVCGGTLCATSDEQSRANSLVDSARTRGNVSTALVIAGAAIAGGGVVLWLTAPRSERSVALAPSASPSSAGLTVVGQF